MENEKVVVEPMKSVEILPDCRAKETRGRVYTPLGSMCPIFCANCGTHGGWCPEENMTFLFWLCNKCSEKWGHLAGTMAMPDEVFWAKIREEQMSTYGRLLSPEELSAVVEAGASPLAALIKEGR